MQDVSYKPAEGKEAALLVTVEAMGRFTDNAIALQIAVETWMDEVGYCPPALLSASDSVSSVPPYFPLFLIQPYVCVLYM